MHILLLVNHYPRQNEIYRGVKFITHVKNYLAQGHKVTVWACRQKSDKNTLSLLGEILENGKLHIVETDSAAPAIYDYLWDLANRFPVIALTKFIGLNPNVIKAKLAARLYKTIEKKYGKPDIIHAHGSHWAGGVACYVKAEKGVPYVVTEHMTIYERNLIKDRDVPFMKKVFKGAGYTLPISPNVGDVLESKIGDDVKPWISIPNMLDKTDFEIRDMTGRANQPFVFFSISRLAPVKRFDLLLEAFAKKFEGKDNVSLRIGGFGELDGKLKALSEALGIQDQVRFLGPLDRDDVKKEMQNCNAYVLSSDYETFAIPLIEAGFSGKPVVATKTIGPDSIVSEDVGILVSPGNADDLANAMHEIYKTAHHYNVDKIREYYLTRYSADVVVEKLAKLYEDVLKAHDNNLT